jgi:hypothetical protein
MKEDEKEENNVKKTGDEAEKKKGDINKITKGKEARRPN